MSVSVVPPSLPHLATLDVLMVSGAEVSPALLQGHSDGFLRHGRSHFCGRWGAGGNLRGGS